MVSIYYIQLLFKLLETNKTLYDIIEPGIYSGRTQKLQIIIELQTYKLPINIVERKWKSLLHEQ